MQATPSSILGGILVLVAAALTFAGAPDDGTTAHKIGYAFGSLILAVLLTSIGRWIQLRSSQGDDGAASEAFWSPGAILALGVVAIIAAAINTAGREAREEEDDREEYGNKAEECLESESDPLQAAPPGFVYFPPKPSDEELFAAIEQAMGVPDLKFDGRYVRRGGVPTGFVLAVPGVGDEIDGDFGNGVRSSAQEQGLDVSETTIAGNEALVAVGPQYSLVAAGVGCYGIQYSAPNEATARLLVEAIAESR